MRSRLALSLAAFCVLLFTPSALAAPAPPKVLDVSVSAVKTDSATLTAEIDLGEKATSYHFEYGTVDCSSNPCTSTPEGQLLVAEGSPREVEANLEGLEPGTTYHFRILVQNKEGKAEKTGRDFKTYAIRLPFGPCPNDFLRKNNPSSDRIDYASSNLPDCRAYEQVSPVDKNGIDARSESFWASASSTGDRFTFLTGVGMPGAEGLQTEIPTWLASRGGGGWSTQGLFAPASAGDSVEVMGWTRDLSRSFQFVRREGPPKEVALLARDSSDRSLTEIVSYHVAASQTKYAFVGASEDGETVLFEANEALAPGAVAGKQNVYAWNSTTGTLRLASPLPEDECAAPPCSAPTGAFAGAFSWMRQATPALEGQAVTKEGGTLAGHYNQDLHALAQDTAHLYFTSSGTGRLYLRLNPAEPQSPTDPEGDCTDPDLACTVYVSGSQKANGTGPNGTDAAGHRPAAFMAASADGKVAFLTSAEKLTNDANTGPEPVPATIARADSDGDVGSLDREFLFEHARGLTAAGGYLYWADLVKGSIGRAKLNGEGDPTELDEEYVTRSQLEVEREVEVETEPGIFDTEPQSFAEPRYVAVEGTHVYWTNVAGGEDGEGAIGRAEIGASGAEEAEPEYVTGVSNPQGIDVDGTSTFLYWGNAGGEKSTRAIGRAKIGTSEAEEVNQAFIPIDVDINALAPEGVASNSSHIYVAEGYLPTFSAGSYIERFDLNGNREGKFRFLGPIRPGGQGIVLDSSHIYWSHQGKDAIGRCDLELESCELEFIPAAGHPIGLALDGERLYWSAEQEVTPNPGNDLYRYEAESGALEDLTPDPGDPNGAEVKGLIGASEDGSSVYFVANGALAPGASAGNCVGNFGDSGPSLSGECNLYLYRDGEPLGLITRLAGTDAANWSPAAPTTANSKAARVSADGRTLLFRSKRQLDASYDNEGVAELYRYRAGEGVRCVSCNPSGQAPSGPATLSSMVPDFLLPKQSAPTLLRNLSADGNRVFFETTDALLPTDTNAEGGCPVVGNERTVAPVCRDVYEWEAAGTGSCESEAHNGGCLYLLSTGKGEEPAFFGNASLEGDHAFFFTTAKLVGQDQDLIYDAYDAAVNGGLASQSQPPPQGCGSAEACRESIPTAPPPAGRGGSETFQGPGNAKGKRCSKVRRKAKTKRAKRVAGSARRCRARKGGRR